MTLRMPSRVPGWDGAKVMTTEQVELAARVAVQLVVSVKSPARARAKAKVDAPVLPMVTVCVEPEMEVTTTTGLAKVRVVGVTVRLGLTEAPLMPGWGRDWPVTRAVRP